MTAVVLSLLAAASWGSSDFMAGLTGRRVATLPVVIGAHVTGLAAVVALLPLLGGVPGAGAIGFGALAGLSGAVGAALLYRGLAIGRMAVVAPVTAAGAASVPVLTGALGGEAPTAWSALGIAVALAAIVLISTAPAEGASGATGAAGTGRRGLEPGLAEAIVSGLGFGGFFVFLNEAPADAGLWPLIGARTMSVAALVTVALVLRRPAVAPAGDRRSVAVVGVLDIAAAALFMVAARTGPLWLVSMLASLYPATTVLLARVVLGERWRRVQSAGLVLALGGSVLLAAG